MKFLKCPVVVIVTGLACFHTSSSNKLSKQMTEGDKITQARKLLRRKGEPLVLLWGGEIPSRLSNRTCWRTTYDQMGHKGTIRHYVESAVFGDPSKQGGVDQMTKLDSLLTLKQVNSIATLQVEPIAKNTLGNMVRGNYQILFADAWCIIIRRDGSPVCTNYKKPRRRRSTAFEEQCCASSLR
uniref:Putative secreted protein n=1 Tax=Amblyomma americanum TaxID=6943 RepID=A0A0C9SFB7_AMBAM